MAQYALTFNIPQKLHISDVYLRKVVDETLLLLHKNYRTCCNIALPHSLTRAEKKLTEQQQGAKDSGLPNLAKPSLLSDKGAPCRHERLRHVFSSHVLDIGHCPRPSTYPNMTNACGNNMRRKRGGRE